MNNAIDGMAILNCGFKFQNVWHYKYKGSWGMAGQSSSTVGVDQFCYRIIER